MTGWEPVKRRLAEILGSEIFPRLMTDPGYQILIYNAHLTTLPGITTGGKVKGTVFDKAQEDFRAGKPMLNAAKLPPASGLTAKQVNELRKAADLCVNLMVLEVDGLACVTSEGAEAKLLTGTEYIYRVWDNASNNATRNWWFSEELRREALRESAAKGITPQVWIRDALAISFDFGKCDRLSRISLADAAGIPAISATGLPMPERYMKPNNKGMVPVADKDYWDRLGRKFKGNKTQYFLPFIPAGLIKEYAWVP